MDILFASGIILFAVVAGLLGSLLGLGGGVIIIPALTLGFGYPMQTAIGASLIGVIATSTGSASYDVRRTGADEHSPGHGPGDLDHGWFGRRRHHRRLHEPVPIGGAVRRPAHLQLLLHVAPPRERLHLPVLGMSLPVVEFCFCGRFCERRNIKQRAFVSALLLFAFFDRLAKQLDQAPPFRHLRRRQGQTHIALEIFKAPGNERYRAYTIGSLHCSYGAQMFNFQRRMDRSKDEFQPYFKTSGFFINSRHSAGISPKRGSHSLTGPLSTAHASINTSVEVIKAIRMQLLFCNDLRGVIFSRNDL